MTRRGLLVLLAALASAPACEDTTRPAEPVWGKQSCEHCRMLVSEPRFAAQAVTPDGERVFFDDVGCLVEHQHGTATARAWVRTEAGAWTDASTARFASGAATPMNYGFVPDSRGAFDFAAVERSVEEHRKERQR